MQTLDHTPQLSAISGALSTNCFDPVFALAATQITKTNPTFPGESGSFYFEFKKCPWHKSTMSLDKLRSDQVDLNYIKNILENLIQAVAELDPTAAVILFGSMVTKNVNNESDIDLAIIVSNDFNETEFRKKLSEKKVLGKWPTDLLIFTKAQFKSNVENIGVICLEIKDNGVELYPHWKWVFGFGT